MAGRNRTKSAYTLTLPLDWVTEPGPLLAFLKSPRRKWGKPLVSKFGKVGICDRGAGFYHKLRNEPVAAHCMAIPVSRNQVLMPAHCLSESQRTCGPERSRQGCSLHFASGYIASTANPEETIPVGQLREGSLVAWNMDTDWAIVRLRTEVNEFFSKSSFQFQPGMRGVAYHFPLGAPMMLGGVIFCGSPKGKRQILSSMQNHSSGGAVFDMGGKLAGMQVQSKFGGEPDRECADGSRYASVCDARTCEGAAKSGKCTKNYFIPLGAVRDDACEEDFACSAAHGCSEVKDLFGCP